MSRPLRIEYPGAWYHVMNRGRRKEDVFLCRQDYRTFIRLLQETSKFLNLKVAAYCLMPNHYHLLAHTPDGNLSRCMRHINGVYTQRFNRTHNTDGQLFRGRYKAVLVDADSYLLEVLRYIHRNPIKDKLVDKLDTYVWSSHKGYISTAKKWEWLYKDPVLDMLTQEKAQHNKSYLNFVTSKSDQEVKHFYTLKNLPPILGADSFKEMLKIKFKQTLFHKEIPESAQLAHSPETIVDLVCDYFEVTREQLLSYKRGEPTTPRDIAIYLIRYKCRDTLLDTGKHVGIDNYSTVSSAIRRIKTGIEKDELLRKTVTDLIDKLT